MTPGASLAPATLASPSGPEELEAILDATDPEVAVDFTKGPEALELFRAAIPHNTSPVVGTTGMSDEALAEARGLCDRHSVGALIAPNFAIGAVLMMKFAQEAAKYLGDVEIIELHHERKMDAPSGTAALTAKLIAESRSAERAERPTALTKPPAPEAPSSMVPIHPCASRIGRPSRSLGGVGQMLTIRHDPSTALLHAGRRPRRAPHPGQKACGRPENLLEEPEARRRRHDASASPRIFQRTWEARRAHPDAGARESPIIPVGSLRLGREPRRQPTRRAAPLPCLERRSRCVPYS